MQTGEIRIPDEKHSYLLKELAKWKGRKACTKRDLLSLIGRLHHTASAIIPIRPFVRGLIKLSKIPKRLKHMVCLNHMVHLNQDAQADIEWWFTFAKPRDATTFLSLN